MRKRMVGISLSVAFGITTLAFGATSSLTILTHDSFDLDKKLVQSFEAVNNVDLKFIKGGDAGAMLSKLVLSKANPIADVAYGVDNALLERAKREDVFEVYKPKTAKDLNLKYNFDPTWHVTPVDYGFVALNYDKAWFETHKLELPKTLSDLTKPAYKGLLVVENPSTSSTGNAFLLATIKTFGEIGALKYWKALRDNDLKVAAGWDGAYYTEFSLNGGTRPVVVSYASSPAAEVFYAKDKPSTAPTANLLLPGASFLQIEGVGILKGTKNLSLAQKFVEFMIGKEVQADIPTRMWIYPVNKSVVLPEIFSFATIPTDKQIASLNPRTIAANSDRWIDKWIKVVIQRLEPSALK
jgi:thiamine transport system substrate-binding protein